MKERAGRTAADDAVRAERNNRICKLYSGGMKIRELVELFGLSDSHLFQIIQKYRIAEGLPGRNVRALGGDNLERNQKIMEMYRSGKTLKSIAAEVGLHKSSVALIARTLAKEALTEEKDDDVPCPPRPKNFGAVKAPKLRIPPLEPGKTYVLPGISNKNRPGNGGAPARRMRFEGFVPGTGCRHAVFVHPVAGYRETFRDDIDLARMRSLRRAG